MIPARGAAAALEVYLEELRRWGARTNLVGSLERSELQKHVADSLAAAPELPPDALVVDLGSGAGFPGIPLAIERPDLRLTLVEIRERRVHFLRHVVRTLDLSVAIERRRIEDPPPEASFEFALLRAVAAPARSLALARAWVTPGGEIWVWTGPGAALGVPRSGEIPLGERGRISRVLAAAVSRGTP